MPIKPKEVEHTFFVKVADGWKPINEVPFWDFGEIEAYRLHQIEPTTLADEEYSFTIILEGYARFWVWWMDWQIQKAVPKISRN